VTDDVSIGYACIDCEHLNAGGLSLFTAGSIATGSAAAHHDHVDARGDEVVDLFELLVDGRFQSLAAVARTLGLIALAASSAPLTRAI